MKPLQIGLLIAAGALGGAGIMKWQSGRHADANEVAAAAPAAPAPVAAAAPAEPAAPEPPAAAPAKEAAAPATAPRATQKPSAARHKPAASSRPEPTVIAQAQPPVASKPAPPVVAAPEPPAPPVRQAPPVSAPPPIAEPVREPAPAPAPAPPEPNRVTIPAGTMIPIRLVDGLSSERNLKGDTFNATLDAPLVVDHLAIAERGARVEGKVIDSAKAGKTSGVASLAIVLTQVTTSDGQRVRIQTQTFTKNGPTSHREDAGKVGAGAGIGAIIGAIAGGGRGAAIGAGVGGAAGAGDVLLTRGKPADLPSETRINFRLSEPVTVTERR